MHLIPMSASEHTKGKRRRKGIILKTSDEQKNVLGRLLMLKDLYKYYAVKNFFNQVSLRNPELKNKSSFFDIGFLVSFNMNYTFLQLYSGCNIFQNM